MTVHELTVLLIEDHPVVRDGCNNVLHSRADIQTVIADTADFGLTLTQRLMPSVILLDLLLPDANGMDIIPGLLAASPSSKIIIFSMHGTSHFVATAFKKGASGYITKNDDPSTILTAIDKVRSGITYLGPAVARSLAMSELLPAKDPLANLSERERQVMVRLSEGKSLIEISKELAVNYKSVANRLASIKQKLGISSSSALIKFAVEFRKEL
jgi:two-component system, NarL family, invasion response regulator UvrY